MIQKELMDMCFAKRTPYAALLFALLFTLCACFVKDNFPTQSSRNLTLNFRGEEYTYLSHGSILHCLGELIFEGSESDDPEQFEHHWLGFTPGIYSVKGDEDCSILIRYIPDDEWYTVYRKSSLPPLDVSVDNCSRLELVERTYDDAANAVHISCGEGMTDRAQIAAFLSDVRSQQTAQEAGLYDLLPETENGIRYFGTPHVLYAFFEEEPTLVLRMEVSSYNNQAYSVSLDGKQYVLPEKWFEPLRGH